MGRTMLAEFYLNLEAVYDRFKKENAYGFAHYFLAKWGTIAGCLFFLICFDNSNLLTHFSMVAIFVFFVGIVNELFEHGIDFWSIKDSRQDIFMDIYGIVSGVMWSIAIFTLTVWFIA